MEIMAEIILNEGINDVLFLFHEDSAYTKKKFSKMNHLNSLTLATEYLFQEIGRFLETAPHIDGDYYHQYWKQIFQDRFDCFSEQKKKTVFKLSQSENSLFIYDDALEKWFTNRKLIDK